MESRINKNDKKTEAKEESSESIEEEGTTNEQEDIFGLDSELKLKTLQNKKAKRRLRKKMDK